MFSSDAELIRQTLARNRQAEQRFVQRVGPVIRARVVRCTQGRGLGALTTEDLVQQVFVHLWQDNARRLRDWQVERGSLEGYVTTIAAHCLHDIITHERTLKARPVGGFMPLDADCAADPRSPEATVAGRHHLHVLWRQLEDHLAAPGRMVLRGLYAEEKEAARLAAELGWSRGRVDDWNRQIRRVARSVGAALGPGGST
jgi:RNA polymerase sigma factor (sigma-70 family)